MKPKAKTKSPEFSRHNRLVQEHVHDPYKTTRKLSQPTVCPSCQAVYLKGRWQWTETLPPEANEEMCQACRRTQDGYPAGLITLTGSYLEDHKSEILNLAKNQEQEEKAQHPLHRIMKIEEHPQSMVISTTDLHLPRRIAEALRRACKGDLSIHYDDEGYLIRVNWNREN